MYSFNQVSIPTSFDYYLSAWIIGDLQAERLAILMPGFLDTKDYPHLKKLGEELAKEGFLTISFDPLGIWESKAPIELYTMSNWLREIDEVVEWCKQKNPQIKQIVIGGHSMGGMLSLLYSASYTIAAAVSIMGPHAFVREETYHERMVSWKADKVKTSYREDPSVNEKKRIIQLPFSFVEDSLQYDVIPLIPEIDCPVLLIAGDSDVLVPTLSVQELAAHFPKELIKVELVSNASHDYRKSEESISQVNNRVLQFLKEVF